MFIKGNILLCSYQFFNSYVQILYTSIEVNSILTDCRIYSLGYALIYIDEKLFWI